jgi:lipoprotein-anchoring transpeptidase ErfK/SrfK
MNMFRPFLLGCALLACGSVAGCRDQASADDFPAPSVSYSPDRISFRPTKLPLVEAATGSTQPIASILNISEPLTYGEYKWDEKGVPPGRVWILVNLKAQTLSVFRGMNEIGTAVTLYGVDKKPTPLGRFKVLGKKEDHWSSLYDAPMPYTLQLTGDGVAIHASDVREGAGTHGCLGVPLDFGRHLFETVGVGDEVLIVKDATGDKPTLLTSG